MKNKLTKFEYILSSGLFAVLAVLFFLVLLTAIAKNTIDMCVRVGWLWMHPGSYVGLFAGFAAYCVCLLFLFIPRVRHNWNWLMKFTHELTHTLVALLFFAKIREFVVRDRECYVSYLAGPVGYVPITLSPYCIPIYTFMLFPFRFAGDSSFLIIFDFLIAFTYAFHVHAFIKQTRSTQPDIEGCGLVRSTTFITFVYMCVLSLIFATPKGGVMKAVYRVFWEYPAAILTDPSGWFHDLIRYF